MELLKDNSHKTHNTNQTDCYGTETFGGGQKK